MTLNRLTRLLNRHCLITLTFFFLLVLVMYRIGESRTFRNLAEKVLESVMAATVDLFISLYKGE